MVFGVYVRCSLVYGNYETGPKVSMFKFPSDKVFKQKWLNFLKRGKDFKPTKNTKVSIH